MFNCYFKFYYQHPSFPYPICISKLPSNPSYTCWTQDISWYMISNSLTSLTLIKSLNFALYLFDSTTIGQHWPVLEVPLSKLTSRPTWLGPIVSAANSLFLHVSFTWEGKAVWGTKLGQFSSVQSLSRVWLFATPWIAARQASLSNSWSSLKLTSIELVMPSSHLILCRPLFLLLPIPPSIRVFSNGSTLRMRWPKYWSFRWDAKRAESLYKSSRLINLDWV